MAVKVKVDRDLCIGCARCARICPAIFALDDDWKAYVIPNADFRACNLRRVVDSCPVGAISVEEG